jgi:membrane-associated phospholipid phosphatase
MNFLNNIDQEIFFFLNHTLHGSFLNALMPLWRSMYFWFPLYVFLISFILYNYGKKGAILLLVLTLTVGVADTTSSQIVKKTVKRLRPCNNPEIKDKVKNLVRCGSGFSFPSSHATNHFAVASFLIFTLFRRKKWFKMGLIAWAGTISLGQVFVGVHYPSDILFGGLLGFSIGFLISFLFKKYYSDVYANVVL